MLCGEDLQDRSDAHVIDAVLGRAEVQRTKPNCDDIRNLGGLTYIIYTTQQKSEGEHNGCSQSQLQKGTRTAKRGIFAINFSVC